MTEHHTNPLMVLKPQKGGPVTREQLENYAARLNAMAFTKANGWHWFVGTTTVDGVERACLDRRDYEPMNRAERCTGDQAALIRSSIRNLAA